ncbi:MAG: peptidoglycan synthetase [Saprospiraceae bacterium]|nr:peptidoglycan synthetase [Saprospiraceae bacterium]
MPHRVHLIAIGGSIMHNLALDLASQGYIVTGSDDQIFEPARSNLYRANLLPPVEGWFVENIDNQLDIVILGMHARKDNPELLRALELGLKIYSFPEFIASKSQSKRRISIAGSHGKTTTCSMAMHTFKGLGLDFDYLVGAQIEGFERMVHLSEAGHIILESDEYLSSCLDPKPKFLHYIPDIAIITGIAWDHFNVFPTTKDYESAFSLFLESMKSGSNLIYYSGDKALCSIVEGSGQHLHCIPYHHVPYEMKDGQFYLRYENEWFLTGVFGSHNFQNMQAVIELGLLLGFDKRSIIAELSKFKGSAKRMEILAQNKSKIAYLDFAHSPSKVKATIQAFVEKYPDRKILLIMELHTYSSLSREFIPQYKDTTHLIRNVILYFDPKAMQLKKMTELTQFEIKEAFNREDLKICTTTVELHHAINKNAPDFDVLVFMGSGQFGGLNIKKISAEWLEKTESSTI